MYTKIVVVLATIFAISEALPYGNYGNYHHFNIYDVINKLDHFDDKYYIAKSWGPDLPTQAPISKSTNDQSNYQSFDQQASDQQSFNQELSNNRIRRDTELDEISSLLSQPSDSLSPVLINNENLDSNINESVDSDHSSISDVMPENDVENF